MTTAKPNIILITTDQQRYDTLGVNGGALRTPHLDRLAEEGVRFEHSYVNNPVCMPSRACIQTGRYTHQHGLRYMDPIIDRSPGLPNWEETFMERLQVGGYATGAVGKIHMRPPKGFDEILLTNGKGGRWDVPYGSPLGPAQLGDAYAHWLENRHPGGYGAIYEQRKQVGRYSGIQSPYIHVLPTEEYIDYWITDNAIDFVERHQEEPFFLWFGLCNPHGPSDPPSEYASLYPERDIQLGNRYLNRTDPSRLADENWVRRFISYYYGLCTLVDDMTGRLFTVLREKGLWDNTLIVFVSDHGEMMGDYGRIGKGNFYESTIRVPLIIKPPKDERKVVSEEGRPSNSFHVDSVNHVVSDLVELIDLAPTILDYAGVRIADTVQGKSLKELMEGQGRGKEAVLCEFTPGGNLSHNAKCLRTDRFKYVYDGAGSSMGLYDLQEDPEEWHNRIDDPAYAGIRIEMNERLLAHLASSEKPILGAPETLSFGKRT